MRSSGSTGAVHGGTPKAAALWVVIASDAPVPVATRFNTQNLRGQSLLFQCLGSGFLTTAHAPGRYQQGRGLTRHSRNWWASVLLIGSERHL